MNLYDKYHNSREDTRVGLFNSLYQTHGEKRVLYPGCFVHISPSFVYRDVVYIDAMKSAKEFFGIKECKEIINKNKRYNQPAEYIFIHSDYSKIKEDIGGFDLLISQYAGFVSQACKKYLNFGALLVVNNSHGDASMAYLDKDYELIGVYKRIDDQKYTITEKDLEQYFIPKKGKHPSIEEVKKLGRGMGYTKSPSGYIFKYTN